MTATVPETTDLDLRSRRTSLGMSVHQLAALLGVHPNTIHRYERLERSPSSTTVRQISEALGLATADVARFFDAARGAPAPQTGVVGCGLRPVRRSRGLSARAIAAALEVGPSTVYNWEHGAARIPTSTLPALAAVLGVPHDRLLEALRRSPHPQLSRPRPSSLRRLRVRRGLSQAEVAERIGYPRGTVGSWERGAVPPLHALRLLAGLYAVSPAHLARLTGVQPTRLLDRRTWAPGQLPEVLRALRQWSGLTQLRLAELCSCSVGAVRAWENGRWEPTPGLRGRLEGLYRLPDGALTAAYAE